MMNKEEVIRILSEMQSNRCTPEMITSLHPNEVFVFGTDPDGKHKSMAAKVAVREFGAKIGEGEGYYGQSYAIPVHKHRTWKMREAISRFILFAKNNPDKKFLVLAIGCGAASMDAVEVSLMFEKAIDTENIFLPTIFIEALKNYHISGCIRALNNLTKTTKECKLSIKSKGISPKGKIAITRYYGFVLDDNGKQIFIGDSTNHQLKKLKSYQKITSITGTFSDEVGLTTIGTIVTSMDSRDSFSDTDLTIPRMKCGHSSIDKMLKDLGRRQFDDFKFIKSISAGEGHIVGVKNDGTVICWDGQGGWAGVPNFKDKVKEWHNIKQVAVGYEVIVGLTNDGRIIGSYENYYEGYHDFIQVDAYGHYYGDSYTIALRNNGTVMSPDFEEVSVWQDIVQIAVGWDVAIGLKRDGRVEITSFDQNVVNIVSSWNHIVNLECKFSQIIAISEDGRIYNAYIH